MIPCSRERRKLPQVACCRKLHGKGRISYAVRMMTIARLMQEGGGFMYIVLVLALPALGLSVTHAAAAKRWSFFVGLGLVVLPLLAGAAGMLLGSMKVHAAIEFADPAHRAELLAVGMAEASLPLKLGAIVFGVGLVPLIIGEVRRRRR
jgi:hypothetical protein